MPPALRKLALTLHVISSVGWLGAVGAFLALAIAGVVSADVSAVRAADVAMDLTTRYVIVPLCFASLLTGLVSSLGTSWGLLRHWWVVIKLLLTVPSTILLLVHAAPIGYVARMASRRTSSGPDLDGLRAQIVGEAAAALLVLVTATVLSVYKPRGLTPLGYRSVGSSPPTTAKVRNDAPG